jgi:lycopene cyclase domain-containing protein
VGSGWLEFVMRARVYRRWLRLILVLIPVVLTFAAWDAYAIANDHWYFDLNQITGIYVGFNIPLDEILFFIVIPICSILTLEAVRAIRPDLGDES